MLRHIVMYKLPPNSGGRSREENLRIAKELADVMEREIPQLRAFHCGINAAEANSVNYDVTLVCDLDDFSALAEYKLNPAHKAFGAHCHAVATDRAAIDFEI